MSFPGTRHSMLTAIASGRGEARGVALDRLAAGYWKPVFKYLRLKWRLDRDDAADLTQAFFLRAIEKDFFAGFDPSRARFRTYLRVCLDRFVANARKADSRIKRGGAAAIVPLDFEEAEGELQPFPAAEEYDFDRGFHREWLRSLFATAIGRLRESCRSRGRPNRFALFERYDLLADAESRPTYAELASALGTSPIDVTNELAAARREFRRLVLEALREQCGTEEEFDAERRLLAGERR
jgi:DNA-directed RNA polymerase specialized sigma24 family protein